MSQFLAPILTLTGLGLFFALVLTFASKKFALVQDPRIREVMEKLPGANCGTCGMAGCARFAEALAKRETTIDNCKVCSEEVASEIAAILGLELSLSEKKVVSLRCHGGKKAGNKFIYQGLKDCQAAAQLLGGQKLCSYACLGFGNCQRACPFGAIRMSPVRPQGGSNGVSPEGLPIIDIELCTGCGKCVQVCPRDLLVLIPRKGKVYVGCSSQEPAKVVASVCAVGCIACKKCEQVCPVEAIKVVENLAVIDYDRCTSCGECIKACPRKIIKKL